MLVAWLFPWKKWPVPSVDLKKHSPGLFLHFLKFIPLQLHHFRSPAFPMLLQPKICSSRQDGMKFLGQKKLLTYKPHPGVKASPNAKIQVSCWPQTFGGNEMDGWQSQAKQKGREGPQWIGHWEDFWVMCFVFSCFSPVVLKAFRKNKCDLRFL